MDLSKKKETCKAILLPRYMFILPATLFLLLQLHVFKSDLLHYLLSLWQSFHLLGALQSDLVYVYKDQELLKVQALGWPKHKQKNE